MKKIIKFKKSTLEYARTLLAEEKLVELTPDQLALQMTNKFKNLFDDKEFEIEIVEEEEEE